MLRYALSPYALSSPHFTPFGSVLATAPLLPIVLMLTFIALVYRPKNGAYFSWQVWLSCAIVIAWMIFSYNLHMLNLVVGMSLGAIVGLMVRRMGSHPKMTQGMRGGLTALVILMNGYVFMEVNKMGYEGYRSTSMAMDRTDEYAVRMGQTGLSPDILPNIPTTVSWPEDSERTKRQDWSRVTGRIGLYLWNKENPQQAFMPEDFTKERVIGVVALNDPAGETMINVLCEYEDSQLVASWLGARGHLSLGHMPETRHLHQLCPILPYSEISSSMSYRA